MINKNIRYKSEEILKFYSVSRRRWSNFYPSERRVFEHVAGKDRFLGDVLDVGCACGGLGEALAKEFRIRSYTGIDIHKDSIEWARAEKKLGVPQKFIAGDIIEKKPGSYDIVISLSCADWNIETSKIIDACWENVGKGGHFIVSLRLTAGKGVNNIKKSYQAINFSGKEEKPEIANYVVLNFNDTVRMLKALVPAPESIGAYGYWGRPSAMAVTPFEKLIFSVFYIRKRTADSGDAAVKTAFDLPSDIMPI